MKKIKSTKEQVNELKALHPDWTNVQISKAVNPPVTPQRVGVIINGTKPNLRTSKYRARNRHRYHVKAGNVSKRKYCKFCKGVQFAY